MDFRQTDDYSHRQTRICDLMDKGEERNMVDNEIGENTSSGAEKVENIESITEKVWK